MHSHDSGSCFGQIKILERAKLQKGAVHVMHMISDDINLMQTCFCGEMSMKPVMYAPVVDRQCDKTRCDEIDSEPQYEAGAKNNAVLRCFVCASAAALLWTRGDRSKVHNGPICKLSSSPLRLAQLFIH